MRGPQELIWPQGARFLDGRRPDRPVNLVAGEAVAGDPCKPRQRDGDRREHQGQHSTQESPRNRATSGGGLHGRKVRGRRKWAPTGVVSWGIQNQR